MEAINFTGTNISDATMLRRAAAGVQPVCAKHSDEISAACRLDRACDAFECLSGACAAELVGYVMDRFSATIDTR